MIMPNLGDCPRCDKGETTPAANFPMTDRIGAFYWRALRDCFSLRTSDR
jgi:hypothetical protein